jgi:hypothetical protein
MSRRPLDLSNYKTVPVLYQSARLELDLIGRDTSENDELWIVAMGTHRFTITRRHIVLGMIARCASEIARAKSEINRDEWAMLGARDWTQELEEWKKLL